MHAVYRCICPVKCFVVLTIFLGPKERYSYCSSIVITPIKHLYLNNCTGWTLMLKRFKEKKKDMPVHPSTGAKLAVTMKAKRNAFIACNVCCVLTEWIWAPPALKRGLSGSVLSCLPMTQMERMSWKKIQQINANTVFGGIWGSFWLALCVSWVLRHSLHCLHLT